MVEIFRTNVNKSKEAENITRMLSKLMKGYAFNFDLEDCDRILRVASDADPIDTLTIIKLLNSQNYTCELLTD